MTWFCFRVPPQREFIAKNFLVEKRGFDADKIFVCFEQRLYIPKIRPKKKAPDRWIARAMTPGYIFISTNDPFEIVRKYGIIQGVLQSDGIARPIQNQDIAYLISISGKVARSTPAPNIKVWVEGDYVRISAGPLSGLKGRVAKNGLKLDKAVLGRDVVKVSHENLEAA